MPNRYYKGPVSDHFDGRRFFQPGLPNSDKSLVDVLRWRLFGKRTPWPNVILAKGSIRPAIHSEALQITAIGHASLLLQIHGCNVLLDPVWAERANPFSRLGPRRRNPPSIAFADLPPYSCCAALTQPLRPYGPGNHQEALAHPSSVDFQSAWQ